MLPLAAKKKACRLWTILLWQYYTFYELPLNTLHSFKIQTGRHQSICARYKSNSKGFFPIKIKFPKNSNSHRFQSRRFNFRILGGTRTRLWCKMWEKNFCFNSAFRKEICHSIGFSKGFYLTIELWSEIHLKMFPPSSFGFRNAATAKYVGVKITVDKKMDY